MSTEKNAIDALDFYDEEALLDRLSAGLQTEDRRVVFVVGSGLTAPATSNGPGIPNVQGVIDLIAAEFEGKTRKDFEGSVSGASNAYQAAFKFLIGRRGQKAANGIIKAAVGKARMPAPENEGAPIYTVGASTDDETCRLYENDSPGWLLTPGVDALGRLISAKPDLFGRMVVTTNFDPLIGAAIARYGGHSFRTFLHSDGSLGQADGDGTHLVYLHGYWYGADTLHTPRQLTQPRSKLAASLAQVIRGNILVIVGYGGWDDVFTQALIDVVIEDTSFPEIIWCFYGDSPSPSPELMNSLNPGLSRGRVNLYAGIDANKFLPRLADAWGAVPEIPNKSVGSGGRTRIVPISGGMEADPDSAVAAYDHPIRLSVVEEGNRAALKLSLIDQDSPPLATFLVGRGDETEALETARFRFGFVTGFGGQGKSVLVSHYFTGQQARERFDYRIWRDCREQVAKFEDQIVNLVEGLGTTGVSGAELARMSIEELAEKFAHATRDFKLLAIFDNVDHYVDLEQGTLIGTAGRFVAALRQHASAAQIVMTCRPPVHYEGNDFFSLRLTGLPIEAADELFRLRGAVAEREVIERAHGVTDGHAFWLDLLAAQVATREPQVQLEDLLESISKGTGEIPDTTLRSIWNSLRPREQIVLQGLAETLRPTNNLELSEYLDRQINFKNMNKALNLIKGLNLVVVKADRDRVEAYELHPLIRAFIQKTFPRSQRSPFILAIYNSYAAFFGLHRATLKTAPAPGAVVRWLEGAELCVNAQRYAEALDCLEDIAMPVRRQEPPSEFCRIANLLFTDGPLGDLVVLDHFESVFDTYVTLLINTGDVLLATEAMADYLATIEGKSARYIRYCDFQCYLHWTNGNYDIAVRWGQEGEDLRTASGVDTQFSTAHNLALAQRDSGAIDQALSYFLSGSSLADAVDPNKSDVDRGGAYYGNIGRCLQLMGQFDSALSCYKKSARIIERKFEESHIENQAYIRQWIGEVFLKSGDEQRAIRFLEASFHKWTIVSAPKASRLLRFIYEEYSEWTQPDDYISSEREVLAWIKG